VPPPKGAITVRQKLVRQKLVRQKLDNRVSFSRRNLLRLLGVAAAGALLPDVSQAAHWGGTETSPIWTGYIEGAIGSGERAAAEVLAAREQNSEKTIESSQRGISYRYPE
jgi:hypothetical protein